MIPQTLPKKVLGSLGNELSNPTITILPSPSSNKSSEWRELVLPNATGAPGASEHGRAHGNQNQR